MPKALKIYSQDLTANPLLSHCDEGMIQKFVSSATIKTYPKGSVIFLQEDEASYFYIIVDGWVKLFRETLDGAEAIIDVISLGSMFGEGAIFSNNIYPHAAQTIEDATIIRIPLLLLKDAIEEDKAFAMHMLYVMAANRNQQDKELEHRDLQSAPQKIGCFLLRLCKPHQEGPIILNLPYDKTLLASRLGMKPETFSRALAKLKKETGISISGATVTFNSVNQLSDYSCSACSSTYPCQDL